MTWNEESKLYAEKLERLIDGINKIIELEGNRVITNEIQERLIELKNNAMILLPKLRTGEFEIAIVGLEKTGKSSVCNALIGVSALPTDDLRCTYTSTCIRPGQECSAIVTFYKKDEFNRDLKEKLHEIGIENAELYSIDNLTLDKYLQLFENVPEDKKDRYDETLNLDIADTLKYKSSLVGLLGNSDMKFNSDQINSDEFKKYIVKPQFAIAVKNVTLISDELKEMPNAVLYDVPGFNSPTLMHEEQTIQKMKSADAIVYIAKGKEPSLTKEVRKLIKIFKNNADSDGALLSEKLFVYANRMDESSDIPHVLEKTRNEWIINTHIMPDTDESRNRIFAGSANAHLGEKTDNGLEIREKLAKYGVDKYGINEIRNALTDYYHTTRFDVLKKRVNKILSEFEDVLTFPINFDNSTDSIRDYSELVIRAYNRVKNDFTIRLHKLKSDNNKNVIEKAPLKAELEKKIGNLITITNYSLSQEYIDMISKEVGDIDGAPQPQKVDAKIREKRFDQMYKEYEDVALTCASDMHQKLYKDILSEFVTSTGIEENTDEIDKLTEDFRTTFLLDSDYNDYYGSLIERFSRDVFEILIKFQHGVDRLGKFKTGNAAANYFSLGVFYNATIEAEKEFAKKSSNNDDKLESTNGLPEFISISPSDSPLWKMLLYPDIIKNQNDKETVISKLESFTGLKNINPTIEKLLDKLITIEGSNAVSTITELFKDFVIGQPEVAAVSFVKEILTVFIKEHQSENENLLDDVWNHNKYLDDLANKHKNYTYKMVSEEFENDIETLQLILIKAVIPAVNLDRAFLARQTRIIENVIRMLNEEVFERFISRNINLIESSNVEKLNNERAQNDLDAAVIKEITSMKQKVLSE